MLQVTNSFKERIYRSSSLSGIAAGIVLILAFNVVLLPYFPSWISDFDFSHMPPHFPLDLALHYSYDDFVQVLKALGPEGRRTYALTELCVDVPYALFYGWVYAWILARLFSRKALAATKAWSSNLVLLPFGIAFFDLCENTGILFGILLFPKVPPLLAGFASISTSLKWAFAIATVFWVLWGSLQKMLSKKDES